MNRDRQLNLGDGVRVEVMDASLATPLEHAKAIAKERTLNDCDEPFFVADLSTVATQLRRWRARLPRVEPFYAVKCNDDVAVLRTLAQLDVGFDCTSKPELRRVLQLGVPSERIICANPCKLTSMICFARDSQVPLMTFDNADELYKIKEHFPEGKLVLRIQPQPVRGRARNSLGSKFGAPYESVARLVRTAKSLELDIVGVSFHVGSTCQDAQQYVHALGLARRVFDDLLAVGYTPYLVDIGGGFPGTDEVSLSFDEIGDALAPALDQLFPATSGVRLIAEPGRFMVARAFLLMVNVIAKRTVDTSSENDTHTSSASTPSTALDSSRFHYYLNDGVYGSFNFLLFDQRTPKAHLAKRVMPTAPRFASCLYGPTCDSLDCVAEDVLLPELFVGDWLYFENMGAYTLGSSPDFSSMPRAERFYLVNQSDALLFRHELAALVAENGSPTSDLLALLGDSFIDEVRTAADVAQHDLELQLQLNSTAQLRDELKSMLREFHEQTYTEAIVQLETFLNAFAKVEANSPDKEPSACVESVSQNACESANPTRCESMSASSTASTSNSVSAADGNEPHTLADEPAVTLIFD